MTRKRTRPAKKTNSDTKRLSWLLKEYDLYMPNRDDPMLTRSDIDRAMKESK